MNRVGLPIPCYTAIERPRPCGGFVPTLLSEDDHDHREHRRLSQTMRSQTSPISVQLISGGSYQENTLRTNIADLQATLLRQRVLVDKSRLNFSIDLWDQTLALPVILGPVGMAGMYSSRGEVKAAELPKRLEFRSRYRPWGCAMCTRSRKRPAFPLGFNSTCSRTVVSSKA